MGCWSSSESSSFSYYPPFYGLRDSVPLHYMYWDLDRRHRGILNIPSHVLDWDGNMLIHIQPVAFKDIIMTLQDFTMLAFAGSLMFLSYVTFKKYALGIACGGYILIIASIIGIVYLCINILNIQPGMNSFCYESSPFYTAVYWLSFAFTPAFLIATLVVLYVAYLKLKEKELR